MSKTKIILLCTSAVACVLCVLILFYAIQPTYIQKIEEYAVTHSQMSFGDVITFQWDVAYNETDIYGRGDRIKELSGYDFEVDAISADHLRRFLFFKDGKLVKTIQYEFMVFEFPENVEVFYPDTIFNVSWQNVIIDDVKYPHLLFELENP